MKFKVGDWSIEKIIKINQDTNTYTLYDYCDKAIYRSNTSWLKDARLLTQEEKVELL